jgi:hypothetical protein
MRIILTDKGAVALTEEEPGSTLFSTILEKKWRMIFR